MDCIEWLFSHVEKHPHDYLGRRMLGVFLNENDLGEIALPSLRNSLRIKPTCKETWLYVGVNCLDDLKQESSLSCLHTWLRYHPEWAEEAGVRIKINF